MDRPARLIRGDKQLADRLGVSRRTIERMNKRGILDSARYRIQNMNAYDEKKVFEILKY